jgi:phenylpropionate dioxygenase-like ring-hydroxylating dioxygenase large terminal subunit
MDGFTRDDIERLVEPDRVHRRLYSDPALFKVEMEKVFGHAWIYVGHDSQIPNPGDYFTTQIGLQPVIMVRHTDNTVRVLYNRCGHKGAQLVGDRCGSVKAFRCCYHGWTFKTDGSLHTIPVRDGYDATQFDPTDPQYGMRSAARVENYRGFVFASMAADGQDLKTYLGGVIAAIDDMVDRSPEDALEVGTGYFRIIQRSNWKIFMENLNDMMHAVVTHQSSIDASMDQAAELGEGADTPFALQILQGNGMPYSWWKKLGITVYRNGHSMMDGIVSPKSDDPVYLGYVKSLEQARGVEAAERILSINRHNSIVWPSMSLVPSFQQVRVIRPLSVDRTLVEVFNFKLKGAPAEMYRKTLTYSNVVNSPSSLVMPDDLEAYRRVQDGLTSDASDWVSQHRDFGRDAVSDGAHSYVGTSELPFRNQARAWIEYMTGAV